ncbi:TnsA-like heteromeric transposase endonuclease subunit [Brachybacterium alimentarium]|uniref:TnsA-like heteromeric transposase endonuclease subunit n=1 Tax=Brachybacterium alimentarium TaxID=47845 RepID=UPI003FD1D0E3
MAAQSLLDTELRYLAEDETSVTTSVRSVDKDRLSHALPVRTPRSYAGQRHYSGLFWSATTRGHVPYESRLELDRLWLADFDPEIVWIAAQPMWLRGRDGNTLRRHAPDFLLLGAGGGVTVVDVKPAPFAARPQVAAVFTWTSGICAARGWRYEVWSGGDPIHLANIRALATARRVPLFTGPGSATEPVDARLEARYRAWTGEVAVDMKVPLSSQALGRCKSEEASP